MSMDDKQAADLARAGFEHWQAGRLDEAVRSYSAAIDVADPQHYATPNYHSEYASVLSAMERNRDALEEYRQALALEESQSGSDSPATAVARYFIGEHCLKMGLVADALAAVNVSISASGQCALLKLIEALAQARLGDSSAAKAAAEAALKTSSSEEQRAKIAARLRDILGTS